MSRFLLSVLICCLVCHETTAQPPLRITAAEVAQRLEQEPRQSVAGKRIESWWLSPRLTAAQEKNYVDAMNTPVTKTWSDAPLSQVLTDLSSIFPIELDHEACRKIGITAKLPVNIIRQDNATLATVLRQAIDPMDLTVQRQPNKLLVTSIEAAEQNLLLKIYDVSTIAGTAEDATPLVKRLQAEVIPDIWMVKGGPAVVYPIKTKERVFLAISATTDVHSLSQALLDDLNASGQGATAD